MRHRIKSLNIGNLRYQGYRLDRRDNALFAPLLASFMLLWLLFAFAISIHASGQFRLGATSFDGTEFQTLPLHTVAEVHPAGHGRSVEWRPCVKI